MSDSPKLRPVPARGMASASAAASSSRLSTTTWRNMRSAYVRAEALFLSLFGGLIGLLLGSGVTALYATPQGWSTVVPAWVLAGGIAATLAVGAVAGILPALRAARVAPTEALAAV